MRGATAERGEDAGADGDPGNVRGRRFLPYQQHRIARRCQSLGSRDIEDQAAHRDADACRRGAGQESLFVGVRQADFLDACQIDTLQLRERRRGTDQTGGDEVDGDAQRRQRRPLGNPRLQHEQLAVLDRELELLRITECPLECRGDLFDLAPGVGQQLLEWHFISQRVPARDDVLTLGVEQEIQVQFAGPGRRVAGKGDTGAGHPPGVAENHPLHRHRGARRIVDVVRPAVADGFLGLPRTNHRHGCLFELQHRVLWKRRAGEFLEECEIVAGQRGETAKVDLARAAGPAGAHAFLDTTGEGAGRALVHDFCEALDQASVAVPGQARIAGAADDRVDRQIVDPDVEQRFHHSRHRYRRPAPHRNEQGPSPRAEAEAALALDMTDSLDERVAQFGRCAAGSGDGLPGEAGGEDETLWNRQSEAAHRDQVESLETHFLDAAGP
ncbi:MAG: hypothetical protein AW08_00272 [Candidatus Accumulibacter adjunctus]|uniref:Uncharacterized protein n=1 Tax=Candidatus Accumulibacter adjunctus TaxID=1454001 RepID=A0A011PTT9_9PROT|nr:MAG: hypothetical protein AW08_00272 [Candidatus Accumulibacter adjunctus]